MFKAANLQLSVSERRNRFEVLTDLVGIYYIYNFYIEEYKLKS